MSLSLWNKAALPNINENKCWSRLKYINDSIIDGIESLFSEAAIFGSIKTDPLVE